MFLYFWIFCVMRINGGLHDFVYSLQAAIPLKGTAAARFSAGISLQGIGIMWRPPTIPAVRDPVPKLRDATSIMRESFTEYRISRTIQRHRQTVR